ncbi:MAG TPA: helix-turn-helix transcriptional regulator, partial [Vicinamibacterales bacterium]
MLVAALRIGDDAYSVPIVIELEKCTGRRVSQAAVFIAVQRLEARGLVTTRLDDRRTETGRTRRYVRLTPAAKRLLRETRDL